MCGKIPFGESFYHFQKEFKCFIVSVAYHNCDIFIQCMKEHLSVVCQY